MAIKFKHGDIFSLVLPNGKYAFGRILLDVNKQCVRPKLIRNSSNLHFFGTSILIEVYSQLSSTPEFIPSKTLIPSLFTHTTCLEKDVWKIVSNEEVNPESINFPEALVNSSSVFFSTGEVELKTSLSYEQYQQIQVYNAILSPYSIPSIFLHYSNLDHLIEEKFRWPKYLERSDLRFVPEIRERIYKMINEDPEQTYCGLSQKYGFDVSRFYNK